MLQVEVRHGKNGNGNGNGKGRSYKVKGLTTKAADEAEFENDQEGGGRMTVAAYFQQAYGIAYAPSLAHLLLQRFIGPVVLGLLYDHAGSFPLFAPLLAARP